MKITFLIYNCDDHVLKMIKKGIPSICLIPFSDPIPNFRDSEMVYSPTKIAEVHFCNRYSASTSSIVFSL